jgi:hypothetical protein
LAPRNRYRQVCACSCLGGIEQPCARLAVYVLFAVALSLRPEPDNRALAIAHGFLWPTGSQTQLSYERHREQVGLRQQLTSATTRDLPIDALSALRKVSASASGKRSGPLWVDNGRAIFPDADAWREV